MNRVRSLPGYVFVLLLCFFALPVTSHAAANALGMDIVRLADANQDDGMLNIFYQRSLSRRSALYLGYSSGEDTSVIDVAWKLYHTRYHSGLFFQVGGAYYDGEESEPGVTAMMGYEHTITKGVVMNAGAKVVFVDAEEPIGLRYGEDPVFQPVVSFMFAF